ncbi:MAG: homoserine dehydrogenase [Clostridia bacterium]|nr:homoserine dehydrogenase [Clostridia bacterium]
MKVAILGYGVVGSGTYEILDKAGYTVGKILDIRPHPELGDVLTTDFDDILNDKEIGVVAEAIGGLEPAHSFLVKAIKAGKHVVSSNKHLICTYYDELHSLAREMGVTVRFSASAGGGIPWLHNLCRATRCDKITRVSGIMNGTTNFIIDAMITDGADFSDVLAMAQSLGYAEADPSADIDGLDTARKTAISSSIAFNTEISEDDVSVFGLRNIKKCDIEYIKGKLNKSIRYVGTGVMSDGAVSTFVEPLIIGEDSLFAGVKKNNNMISLVGENVGELSFFGQGAGKYPTGVSVAQDVIDIVNGDFALITPGQSINVDNGAVTKQYYVRTKADVPSDLIDSLTKIGDDNFIITKEISVLGMHKLSKEIIQKDGVSFFAGIER